MSVTLDELCGTEDHLQKFFLLARLLQIKELICEIDDARDWIEHLMGDRSCMHPQVHVCLFYVLVKYVFRNVSYRDVLAEAIVEVNPVDLNVDQLVRLLLKESQMRLVADLVGLLLVLLVFLLCFLDEFFEGP